MKETYRQKIEAQLKEWDDHIEALEQKAKLAEGLAKSTLDIQIQDLKEKREMLLEKLRELQETTDEKWDSFKPGLVKAIKALQEEFSKVFSKMR